MLESDFDNVLAVSLGTKKLTRKFRGRLQRRLDEQMALAVADPQGWTRTNADKIRMAGRRKRIRERLEEELPEYSAQEHDEYLTAYLGDGPPREWSEEKKAKWHAWIQRAIPFLKIFSAVTPPPWNLAIIALIVFLTLIDQRRLQPAELAALLATGV